MPKSQSVNRNILARNAFLAIAYQANALNGSNNECPLRLVRIGCNVSYASGTDHRRHSHRCKTSTVFRLYRVLKAVGGDETCTGIKCFIGSPGVYTSWLQHGVIVNEAERIIERKYSPTRDMCRLISLYRAADWIYTLPDLSTDKVIREYDPNATDDSDKVRRPGELVCEYLGAPVASTSERHRRLLTEYLSCFYVFRQRYEARCDEDVDEMWVLLKSMVLRAAPHVAAVLLSV